MANKAKAFLISDEHKIQNIRVVHQNIQSLNRNNLNLISFFR